MGSYMQLSICHTSSGYTVNPTVKCNHRLLRNLLACIQGVTGKSLLRKTLVEGYIYYVSSISFVIRSQCEATMRIPKIA